MRNVVFYSNWFNSNLLVLAGAVGLLLVYETRHSYPPIGLIISLVSVLWVIYARYTTYVSFNNDCGLVNSKQAIINNYKIPISSIVYVARTPQFVFRSWGGRMMIFYQGDNGKIMQTSVIESFYSHETLRGVLKKLIDLNPRIELDEEYAEFVVKYDPNSTIQLKSTPPLHSMKEVEEYISSRYGKP